MMQTETGANAAGSPAAGAADSETPSTADIDPGQAAFEPETSSRAATEEPARPEAEAVTDKAPDKAEAQSETDKAPEKAAETDKAEAQSETDKAPDKAAETNKAEAQSETDKAPEPGKTEAQSETDTAEVKPEGPTFAGLGLPEAILTAVEAAGYTTPTPIQCGTIPALLDGRDVLGQAQTGTGKTAAFALPLLARLNTSLKAPQVLVLAPTRELALQVAEAFRGYATTERSVKVVSLVGGRDDGPQVRDLKRGAAVVIGTPGRVMDHMRRRQPQARQALGPRPRRSRRDARHGLPRGCRVGPRAHSGRPPGRAVLGDHARCDPLALGAVPAGSQGGLAQGPSDGRGDHSPSGLDRASR